MTGDPSRRQPPDGVGLPPTPSFGDESYSAYLFGEYYGEAIPALVFRLKDGSRVAKAYHWLGEVEYLPGLGVRLTFADAVFTVRGRNLLGLFTAVSQHAVRLVWEADRSTSFLVPESEPLVEAVERTPPRG
jgi:hypothetical protein